MTPDVDYLRSLTDDALASERAVLLVECAQLDGLLVDWRVNGGDPISLGALSGKRLARLRILEQEIRRRVQP